MRRLIWPLMAVLMMSLLTPARAANSQSSLDISTQTIALSATRARVKVTAIVRADTSRHSVKVKITLGDSQRIVVARQRGNHYVARTQFTVKRLTAKTRVKAYAFKMSAIRPVGKIPTAASARISTITAGRILKQHGHKVRVATRASSSITVTGTISPGHGRKVVLQYKTAKGWKTSVNVSERRAKKSRWHMTFQPKTQIKKWRIRVLRSSIARPVTALHITVATHREAGAVERSSNEDSRNSGNKDTRTWSPGQRNCLDNSWYAKWNPETQQMEEFFGEPIPGCLDFGPATVPAISTIIGRYVLDDRCGVSITCWRKPTPNELEFGIAPNKLVEWSPPPSVDTFNDRNPEPSYIPDLVEGINEYAVAQGWITQQEIDTFGPPFREIKTPLWDNFAHSVVPGYGPVVGHGGPSLRLAKSRAVGRTRWEVSTLPRYTTPNDDPMGFHSWGNRIGEEMNDEYPVPGLLWSCSEQGWQLNGSITDVWEAMDEPHYVGLQAQVTGYVDKGYRGAAYVTYGAYRWANGVSWSWINFCRLYDPEVTIQVGPNLFVYQSGMLPGDPWA